MLGLLVVLPVIFFAHGCFLYAGAAVARIEARTIGRAFWLAVCGGVFGGMARLVMLGAPEPWNAILYLSIGYIVTAIFMAGFFKTSFHRALLGTILGFLFEVVIFFPVLIILGISLA